MSKPEAKALQGRHHLIIFLTACVLLVSRRPDAIFHAQFFAEDGFAFYADAYNFGWFSALVHPYFGYFHLVPRIAAAFALLVPFCRAPLVMNVLAIAIDALPVNVLLSSRCAGWGSLQFRALVAAGYLAIPAGPIEIFSTASAAQWVLVICALLILAGSLPRNRAERICDLILILASGLSGPFCFFLLPIACFIAYRNRDRWRWVLALALLLCASVQGWALLVLKPEARSAHLGATPYLFARILGENIYLGTFLGAGIPSFITGKHTFPFELFIAVTGTLVAAICFSRARRETKLFCVLACMVLGASLISPTSTLDPSLPRWPMLAPAHGIRYWFLPTLAFLWLLIDAACSNSKVLKATSVPFLVLFCLLNPFLWRITILHDLHFPDEAARFQSASAGTTMIIPLNPEGASMRLIKHGGEGR